MNDILQYGASTTIPGWTCPKCGSFVPNDTYHVCWMPSQESYTTILNTKQDNDEIKELLERVITILERIEKRL